VATSHTSSQEAQEAQELPVLSRPSLRADGARNRRAILEAARRLFRERGVANVRVADVAREARVGKATVFRHFGDRSGLVVALLDDEDRELQDRILRGPPPLGPGAPACERLHAFLDALTDLLERFGDLMFDSENAKPGARYRIGSYHAWRQHVTVLLRQANPDGADPSVLAHAVLGPLAADLFAHLRGEARVSSEAYRTAIHALAEGLCPEQRPDPS
jgi:AcrR family transcriptional regulator